jgi:Flp pilus assembly protein TadD
MTAGQLTAAAQIADEALEAGAEPGRIHELRGTIAFGTGDFAAAAVELERAVAMQKRAAPAVARLAAAYARLGRVDEARALLGELEASEPGAEVNFATAARVHLALGDRDRALTLLERGADERQRDVLDVRDDPFFAALRGDARFARLLARIGLELAAPPSLAHPSRGP